MRPVRLLRPLLALIARRALKGERDAPELRVLVDATFAHYERNTPEVALERTFGARLMVRLAALTLAFHEALVGQGVSAAEASRLTARATWVAYEKMALVPRALAALTTRDPRRRLERATRIFRWFPFGPPGYVMLDVEADPGVVAFDVRRCPVAEHFRKHDRASVCVESFCNLDFPLARQWDATLERRLTIAGGAERCDFRWHHVASKS